MGLDGTAPPVVGAPPAAMMVVRPAPPAPDLVLGHPVGHDHRRAVHDDVGEVAPIAVVAISGRRVVLAQLQPRLRR